ncbi:hypothetical protein MMC28_001297 [Mycoblastus sanguinarius]|nr:hypothetical protein [Mycoblastus sanguinarius]
MIHTEIEIAIPPQNKSGMWWVWILRLHRGNRHSVYPQFLDFPRISEGHEGLVKSLTPVSTSDEDLAIGSLDCKLEGIQFISTIKENSPTCLQWQGPPIYGLIAGLHTHPFVPSAKTSGSTDFIQDEEYTGMLAFAMSPSLVGRRIKGQFD